MMMNDGGAASEIGAGDDAGAGGGDGGAGDGGQGGGAAATPEWLAALPDDLKSDPTLARFGDVEKLARGALDLKRLSSSRVIVPGADADEAAWNAFYDAAGRPSDPSKYEIPVPDGQSAELADAFRPVAHKLGLLPQQAKALVEWNNQLAASKLEAQAAASRAELDAFKAETPDYDAKLASAKGLVKSLGIDAAIADQLDTKLGTANLMKLFFGLAEKAGEHGRVDGDTGALGLGGDPDAVFDAKMKDDSWRERVKVKGSPERAEYDRLLAASKAKAAGPR